MNAPRKPKRPVETTRAAFEILEFLKLRDGANLNEVTTNFDVAKSTAHRHLETLEHLEYVVREDGRFYPSLRFLDFGAYARNRIRGYEMAKEKVDQLAVETNERVQFIVEENGRGVYVYKAIGDHAVYTDFQIGSRVPLHTNSAGKSILASLPKEQVERIIEYRGLPPSTENSITDEATLFEQLEQVRERGYAINDEESVNGLRAIGAPIVAADEVVGAISVSGPVHRMKGDWFETELPDLLLGTANELELNISHAIENQ